MLRAASTVEDSSLRHFVLMLIALNGTLPEMARAAGVTHASVPPGWAPDVKAASAYARGRAGTVSFAVRTKGRFWGRDARRSANSASVIKAMLMVTYLNHPSVRDRELTAQDQALLSPMIRWSSNDAATAVHNYVGDALVMALAKRARMSDFKVAPAWGLSQINARDQSRFFLRLPELTPQRHRRYALRLLGNIVPEQRWGVGQFAPRGWKLHFKGGWSSGTGAVSHQVALLRRGKQRVSIAILTNDSPTHAYSEQTLRGVAKRLMLGLRKAPRSVALFPTPTCIGRTRLRRPAHRHADA